MASHKNTNTPAKRAAATAATTSTKRSEAKGTASQPIKVSNTQITLQKDYREIAVPAISTALYILAAYVTNPPILKQSSNKPSQNLHLKQAKQALTSWATKQAEPDP